MGGMVRSLMNVRNDLKEDKVYLSTGKIWHAILLHFF
jgi:hypothetical protein